MQIKEEKICTYTQFDYRLQLVRIVRKEVTEKAVINLMDKFQIRENRKIIITTLNEYQARKIFAQTVTNIVLQLKIC